MYTAPVRHTSIITNCWTATALHTNSANSFTYLDSSSDDFFYLVVKWIGFCFSGFSHQKKNIGTAICGDMSKNEKKMVLKTIPSDAFVRTKNDSLLEWKKLFYYYWKGGQDSP